MAIFDNKTQSEIKNAVKQYEEEEKRKMIQAATNSRSAVETHKRKIDQEVEKIIEELPSRLLTLARSGWKEVRICERLSGSDEYQVYKYKKLRASCRKAGFTVWDEKTCQALFCGCYALMVKIG